METDQKYLCSLVHTEVSAFGGVGKQLCSELSIEERKFNLCICSIIPFMLELIMVEKIDFMERANRKSDPHP